MIINETELIIDAVKMTPKEQENLRLQIIRLHKKGKTTAEIVELTDAKIRSVQSTVRNYKIGGIAAVKQKKMGRPHGSTKLTLQQVKEIQKIIVDKTPEQMKFKFALWDRRNIAELIEQKYKVIMPLSTMGYYLRKWGFTAQRPYTKHYKQNPVAVQKWMDEEYPEIKDQAKLEGGEIFWGDETGVQNESNYIKGYAPKGQTPTLKTGNDKMRINMISALSNQGALRFMCYQDNMNQQKLIVFMKRLVKDSSRKVFLVLDNLTVHHGKLVKAYLDKNKESIEVFYLPSYAPERNPDEYLNGNLKREIAKHGHAKSMKELHSNTSCIMRKIQNNKEHVKSYFKNDFIKYAAQ
jgi:transposase